MSGNPSTEQEAEISLFDVMRVANAEYVRAESALPTQPSASDVAAVIDLMRAYLSYGPWEPIQIDRLCAARHARLTERVRSS